MQTHGGVSRCFVELYRHLPTDISAEISLRECNNAYIIGLGLVPRENEVFEHWLFNFRWPYKSKMFTAYQWLKWRNKELYWNKFLYNQSKSIELLKKGSYDIFHPTFFDTYFLPYLQGKPFVLTIHDMIPELYPQYYNQETDSQIFGKRIMASKASAIIAVSEKTKDDVIRILRVPEEKVHVIYHGCSFKEPDLNNISSDYPFDYVLYVGDRLYYKNFSLFVQEIATVLHHHPKLMVVCTGIDFNKEELSLMAELEVKDRFIHTFVKTDAEFYSLYHFARCFVYTSEYEGFGIPILEAYKADCPVLLNHASCFPEIAGDAAVYFDMKQGRSNFGIVLEAFLSMSSGDIEALKERQRKRLADYSWERSALKLAEVYQNIVQ